MGVDIIFHTIVDSRCTQHRVFCWFLRKTKRVRVPSGRRAARCIQHRVFCCFFGKTKRVKVPLDYSPRECKGSETNMSHSLDSYDCEQRISTDQPFCFSGDAGETPPAHQPYFETSWNIDTGSPESPNLGLGLSQAQRLRKKRGARVAASFSSPSHANH